MDSKGSLILTWPSPRAKRWRIVLILTWHFVFFGFLGRVLTLALTGDEILLARFQGLYDQVPSYPITYNTRETSD